MQNAMFPHDFSIQGKEITGEVLDQALTEFVQEQQLQISKKVIYQYYTIGVSGRTGNQLDIYSKGQKSFTPNLYILAISESDYQGMTGQNLQLKDDEVAIFEQGLELDSKKDLQLADKNLKIKRKLKEDFVFGNIPDPMNMIVPEKIYMVAKNPSQIFSSLMNDYAVNVNYYGGLNLKLPKEEQRKLKEAYQEKLSSFNTTLPENQAIYGSVTAFDKQEIKGMLGGMFFIGIFLSIVFMLGTVLIIYYKQISEGYYDKDKFEIMQKVGMSKIEVKKTIRKQVLMVFFAPLVMAGIHVIAAFRMISQLLLVFGMTNVPLFALCTVVTFLVFAVIYAVVYAVTAREYYKIVG